MAARRPYLNAAGKVVPSVTTIIGRFKESGGLIHWAWTEGCEGRDYRETRDAAASSGTLAHKMVECEIRGRKFDEGGLAGHLLEKANRALVMYREWAAQTQLVPVQTEVRLVSERHQFGGTLDAISCAGRRALLDWKTSGGIYVDYMIQLAAYRGLWDEAHPDEPIDGGCHLIRFSKEDADFGHYYWSDLSDAWEAFILMRRLYDLDRQLKGRLK